MKTRNPVAGNAHRYNKAKIIPNKRRGAHERETRDYWVDERDNTNDE